MDMPAYLVVLLLMCPAVMLMIGFSVFIPRNRQRHQIQGIFARLKEVYREAESGSASEEDLKQFAQLAERCIGIINRRPDSEWARGFGDVLSMRGRIQQMSLSLVLKGHAKPVLVGSEIEKLAELRKTLSRGDSTSS